VAIDAAYPQVEHIRCYEYSVDNEYPNEMPPCADWEKNGRRVKRLSRAALRRNSLGTLVERPNESVRLRLAIFHREERGFSLGTYT
jgi:hypothetical protein